MSAAVLALLFGLVAIDRWATAALAVCAVYAAFSYGIVNPVYKGLGPLEGDPVAQRAAKEAQRNPGAKAVTLGGRELPALVRGGGLQVLSGSTFYPDPAFWESVLPDQERIWNNYRNYSWYYDPSATPITATETFIDSADLRVDLCADEIRALGFTLVFSLEQASAPCLRAELPLDRRDTPVYVYQVVD